ncbi:thioredoxin family protein [Allochromatium palmeri]|uniref:Thioredoxin fold domain-containing protein n=1 Tax=Allochromatium palmeri TaxID=231048 RepID=A0A6N8EDA0_9GAMM|nr:thioredoxin fold domain-containing protein [Allochromatium palmeri]MTW21581.1 thioredoxin fold domain-containing protein [Allochromatium palmeri]
MSTHRSRILALSLGALLALPLLAQGAEEAAKAAETATPAGKVLGARQSVHPDWFKESFLDIDEDIDEATELGKHLILLLEMNGCPYCARMVEENFAQAPYRDFIQEKFDVIVLNVQGDREVALDAETSLPEKELAQRLGVRYTPTVIFLNAAGEPVARVDGYRNTEDFKRVLDYVATRAYENQTLAEFITSTGTGAYSFRPHPRLQSLTDLSTVKDQPLAVLFEDAQCLACNALHDGHLAAPEVDAALAPFVLVRLDALADTPIITPDGQPTTARDFANTLKITYRPTLVLYDQGREIARIESDLYRYHFVGLLEYVGQRQYQTYPDSPFDYINAKTAERIAAGQDVHITDD